MTTGTGLKSVSRKMTGSRAKSGKPYVDIAMDLPYDIRKRLP